MAPHNDPNTPSTPTITQPPSTPSPYTPTNEGVVTQTPLTRHNNSSFITPRALHSQANDVGGNDPFFFLNSYGNDDNPVQSPMANPSTVAVSVTQTQSSPDLTLRSALDTLMQIHSSKGKKRGAMKDIKQSTAKVRRVLYPIKNRLLTFLRSPYIAPSSTGTFRTFLTNYKLANNHWQNRRIEACKPFKSVELKNELMSAPQALLILHNRLLLEDIMLFEKNDSVITLLSMNHLFLTDERHSPTWKKRLLASWEIKPFRPHQLQKTVYYCVKLSVSSNPNGGK